MISSTAMVIFGDHGCPNTFMDAARPAMTLQVSYLLYNIIRNWIRVHQYILAIHTYT